MTYRRRQLFCLYCVHRLHAWRLWSKLARRPATGHLDRVRWRRRVSRQRNTPCGSSTQHDDIDLIWDSHVGGVVSDRLVISSLVVFQSQQQENCAGI